MSRAPDFEAALRTWLAHRLGTLDRQAYSTDGLKRAAVALVLVPDGSGRACVILTRRALHLSRHSGQFALPGGRIDAGETPVEAALRELHEEVGLELPEDRVLGLLDDYVTRSGYHMSTVVAWGDPAGGAAPESRRGGRDLSRAPGLDRRS